MSAREWRPGQFVASILTGDAEIGAGVFVDSLGRGVTISAHYRGRVYAEGPIDGMGEAQTLAEEWLDRREAQQAQKGGTT